MKAAMGRPMLPSPPLGWRVGGRVAFPPSPILPFSHAPRLGAAGCGSILTYLGLLYQDLIRTKRLPVGGKLPPVLPVVLYNGPSRWRAATEIAELVESVPGGLESYCPHLRYLLLDEGALDESDALTLRNLAAALFRLEKSQAPQDLRVMVRSLVDWLQAPEQVGLRRAFTVWIKRMLLPGRLPGVELPEVVDLQEVETMLSERVLEWTEQWKQEGLEQGRQEGRQEGERRLLQRLLTRRFGILPEWVVTRLEEAGLEALEAWSERVLDAETVEEVFQ